MVVNSAISKEKDAEQAAPEEGETVLVKQTPPTKVPDEQASQT